MKSIHNPKLIQLETTHNNINKKELTIMIISILIVGLLVLTQL